jgi:hypothetical protein
LRRLPDQRGREKRYNWARGNNVTPAGAGGIVCEIPASNFMKEKTVMKHLRTIGVKKAYICCHDDDSQVVDSILNRTFGFVLDLVDIKGKRAIL